MGSTNRGQATRGLRRQIFTGVSSTNPAQVLLRVAVGALRSWNPGSLGVGCQFSDRAARGAGHALAEGDAVEEVLAGQPAAAFDQVALHVADGGDRVAEAPGAQAEDVAR